MSPRLIAVLALFGASVIPAPATAGGGNANAAWWFLGGAVVGHVLTRPVPPPYGHQPYAGVVVVERRVVPSTVVVADPKTAGTPCRDNKTGRVARWQQIDGQMWC